MSILVYIASPYTGNEEDNTALQILIAEKITKMGFLPFWPLCTHYWNLEYPHDYEFWMKLDFQYIERCDALLRVGGKSNGADREYWYAKELGIPTFRNLKELQDFYVLDDGDAC